jgi:hypothetical protein
MGVPSATGTPVTVMPMGYTPSQWGTSSASGAQIVANSMSLTRCAIFYLIVELQSCASPQLTCMLTKGNSEHIKNVSSVAKKFKTS